MLQQLPVFGICGYSGSGKTTVIEEVIRRLTERNLKIGVIKHDVHGLDVDHAGKDSDRFFKAGADVIMQGPNEDFFRAHRSGDADLLRLLTLACRHYDLILVEGHKSTPLFEKVWVLKDRTEKCPPEAVKARRVLRRDEDRVGIVLRMIEAWLPKVWLSTPVQAGILIGGKSRRMGRPKHLIISGKQTWLERTVSAVRPFVSEVVLLGGGGVPAKLGKLAVLPDARDADGPLAGMLSAMRWSPLSSWLFVACDLPFISGEAIAWLLSKRAPGVWATIPKLREGFEPLFAHYDFRAHRLLAECDNRPSAIAKSPKVITPLVPDGIAACWTNVNTPGDLIGGSRPRKTHEDDI